MERQREALQQLTTILQQDEAVQALFVKGSLGRGEGDEHSDIDLYCLVAPEHEAAFLERRLTHLAQYRPIVMMDDVHFVAPQMIVVYDNLLHLDFYVVTVDTFPAKDYFRMLYDPEQRLVPFLAGQSLTVSDEQLRDSWHDAVWFLFQHWKSAARGNDLWSATVLQEGLGHLVTLLLARYAPERAQLGLKACEQQLPRDVYEQVIDLANVLTPNEHRLGRQLYLALLAEQEQWCRAQSWYVATVDQLLVQMKCEA